MITFINPAVSAGDIRRRLMPVMRTHEVAGGSGAVLEGAIVIGDFLEPEARQHLEGQIYSSGSDLARVYRTSRTGFGQNELSIAEADSQIPLLGELRRELDIFLTEVFDGELSVHAIQLRELAPKSFGHPRHVDYARGIDVVEKDGESALLTSVSLSLPISFNRGRAPVFIMETEAGNVEQDQPGSLAIFGPTIFHAHPPTDALDHPYLWLVTQAFFKTPVNQDQPKRHRTVVQVAATGLSSSPATPSTDSGPAISIAAWAANVVTDAPALETLRISEQRIQRAYRELLSGYDTRPESVLNEVERVTEYPGIVLERDIPFTSMCGHHFLPFHGTVDVAYEPDTIITGLGKIPRLVDVFARRLQLQELMIRDIARQIETSIGAKGVLVVARAIHLCVHGRGPKAPGAFVTCSFGLGSLEAFQKEVAMNGPAVLEKQQAR